LKELWIAQNLCGGPNIIQLRGAFLDGPTSSDTQLPALVFEYVHATDATQVNSYDEEGEAEVVVDDDDVDNKTILMQTLLIMTMLLMTMLSFM